MVMLCVNCYSISLGKFKLYSNEYYIKGCKVQIKIEYTVTGIKLLGLDSPTLLPFFVMEELMDDKGEVVKYDVKPYIDSPPSDLSKNYFLKKDMNLLMTRDLSIRYTSLNEGNYKYVLYDKSSEKQILSEITISIIDTTLQTKYTDAVLNKIDLSIVKTNSIKFNDWYLKCYRKYKDVNPISYYKVPADTKITKAAQDFNNNIWIILENNKKYELLLWNQKLSEYQVLIPWDEKEIIIGNSEVSTEFLPFIVAGRQCVPFFTTTSISPLHATFIE